MLVFARMRALSEFVRRELPFLRTIEDHDVVWEIGHYQALGAPLTLKQLLVVGIGSVATVQRRLQRLKRLDVVHQSRSQTDRRVFELTLNPSYMRAFVKYGMILSGAQTASTAKHLANSQGRHLCALCDGDASC